MCSSRCHRSAYVCRSASSSRLAWTSRIHCRRVSRSTPETRDDQMVRHISRSSWRSQSAKGDAGRPHGSPVDSAAAVNASRGMPECPARCRWKPLAAERSTLADAPMKGVEAATRRFRVARFAKCVRYVIHRTRRYSGSNASADAAAYRKAHLFKSTSATCCAHRASTLRHLDASSERVRCTFVVAGCMISRIVIYSRLAMAPCARTRCDHRGAALR